MPDRYDAYHDMMRPQYVAHAETLKHEAALHTTGRGVDLGGHSVEDCFDCPNSMTGGQGFNDGVPGVAPDVIPDRAGYDQEARDAVSTAADERLTASILTTLNGRAPILPTDPAARKEIPVATGFIDYFPDAVAAVAALSKVGNDQHNPGKPLQWDRTKSTDEADTLMRHFLERGTYDTDGVRHSAKVAWRALALLQKEIEAARAVPGYWPEDPSPRY